MQHIFFSYSYRLNHSLYYYTGLLLRPLVIFLCHILSLRIMFQDPFRKELPHFHFILALDGPLLNILLSCLILLQIYAKQLCVSFKFLDILNWTGSIQLKIKQYITICKHWIINIISLFLERQILRNYRYIAEQQQLSYEEPWAILSRIVSVRL